MVTLWLRQGLSTVMKQDWLFPCDARGLGQAARRQALDDGSEAIIGTLIVSSHAKRGPRCPRAFDST